MVSAAVTSLRSLYDTRRFDVIALMLAAMFPIYRSFTSVVMVFLYILSSTLLYYLEPKRRVLVDRANVKYFFITTGFYLWIIVSLTYTSESGIGVRFLISNLYLLIYPLVTLFLVQDLSKKHINQIAISFIVACVLLAVYIHSIYYKAGLYSQLRPAEYNDLPFRDALMKAGYHPTYVSMWFLFGALFLIQFILKEQVTKFQKTLSICVSIVLVLTSGLLSAKIALMAFVIGLLIIVYFVVSNKLVVFIGYVGILVLFILLVWNISFLRARFIDEFNVTELKAPIGLRTNSLNIRVGIYECSWKVFSANWLIGTGIGDAQSELNKCYSSFDTDVYDEGKYNTHNNYLAVAVSTGTVGLISFLFMLIYHLFQSIKHKNLVFILFLVFVMICFMAENILSRNHGVVFYSLFCAVLARQNLQKYKSA